MKRFVLVCVVVLISGCDWAEAQRQAECRAGKVSSCDGGLDDAGSADSGTPDSGELDAGASDDAGTSDAGTPDAGTPDAGIPLSDAGVPHPDSGVLNPNHPVAPRRDIVGLFPRGDAGALWLVLRSGEARQLDRDGLLDGSVSLPGEIIDAYADGVAQPLLAALVDGGTNVVIFDERNRAVTAASPSVPGRWVTTYASGTASNGSVWDNGGSTYRQTLISPSGMPMMVPVSTTSCRFSFFDLQVMRVDEGDQVILAYEAEPGCGGDREMPADAGLAFITSGGGNGTIETNGRFHRLGRLEGENAPGLATASVLDAERVLAYRSLPWSSQNNAFQSIGGNRWQLSADAGLTLGDVSGNVVSGVAYGPISGPFGTPAGFVAGTPTAFVASDTWAVPLGPTPASSHVPVLRVGGRVFVAWLELDGGVRTRVLNAGDGGL